MLCRSSLWMESELGQKAGLFMKRSKRIMWSTFVLAAQMTLGALRRLAICLRPDCYCLVCLLAAGMQDAIQLCIPAFGRSAVIHIEMYAQL